MPYYSSKNIVLDTQKFNYYDEGGCSTIYKKDDTLLKIYNYECKYRYYLSKKMFLLLKTVNIPNLVKLKDYYHRYNGRIDRLLPMDAYTMEFVKGKKINLLDQNRDYLNYIINELEDTLDELSKNKVILEDPSSHNIIFTEKGVTIIDPDQFIRVPVLSRKELYRINKTKIIQYINKTIEAKRETENVRYIYSDYNSSLTKDFNDFLTGETINETIQKKVYKSI